MRKRLSMIPCLYYESMSILWVNVYTMSLCLYPESMSIPWVLANNKSHCLHHESRNLYCRNTTKSLTQITEIFFTQSVEIQVTGIQKFKLKKYVYNNYRNKNDRNTNYRNTHYRHMYNNFNYRNTEKQIKEAQKYKLGITKIQAKQSSPKFKSSPIIQKFTCNFKKSPIITNFTRNLRNKLCVIGYLLVLLLNMIYGWIWIMGEYELWLGGQTHKQTNKKNLHTDRHINAMTRPGLGAGPSENMAINPTLFNPMSIF